MRWCEGRSAATHHQEKGKSERLICELMHCWSAGGCVILIQSMSVRCRPSDFTPGSRSVRMRCWVGCRCGLGVRQSRTVCTLHVENGCLCRLFTAEAGRWQMGAAWKVQEVLEEANHRQLTGSYTGFFFSLFGKVAVKSDSHALCSVHCPTSSRFLQSCWWTNGVWCFKLTSMQLAWLKYVAQS